MLVNDSKNITFDLKINYRFIQSILFVTEKIITQFLFLDEYYSDYLNTLNANVGHNLTYYELFQNTLGNFRDLKTQVSLYINVNPNIYVEQMYLNNIIPLVRKSFLSLGFFLYYFSSFFYGSNITTFTLETFEIIESNEIITVEQNKSGIFNLMKKNNTFFLTLTLNILGKIFQSFHSYATSLFSKLDNQSETIFDLTQILIPNFFLLIDKIANYFEFLFYDLEIIRNYKIQILTTEISERFRSRARETYKFIIDLEIILADILNSL